LIDLQGPGRTIALLIIALIVAGAGVLVARRVGERTGWAAAGGFLLIAFAPLVPNQSIAFGLSLDDILPLVGVALLAPLVPWGRLTTLRFSHPPTGLILGIGMTLLLIAGLISAIANASDPVEFLRFLARGAGRTAFLAIIVVSLAVLGSDPRARRFVAVALAGVGTFEAAFGLVAYLIGLPFHAGLEPTRRSTVLYGEIPGRISGTLGVSPNFTGAILLITILVTAGLALQSTERRERLTWWALAVVQVAALALTYSRVSLALTVAGLAVLVILRSRPVLLAPIAVVLAAVAIFTPMLSRLVGDVPDRLALWTSGFLMMIDHPFTGVGPGQVLATLAADPDRYRYTPFGSAVSTVHNTVLMAGAEAGLLAALGAAVVNVGLVYLAYRTYRTAPPGAAGALPVAAALALVGFLAQGMVNNLFTVGVTGVYLALLVGGLLLEAYPASARDEAAVRRREPGRGPLPVQAHRVDTGRPR